VTDRKVTFNNHFGAILTSFWYHHDCLFWILPWKTRAIIGISRWSVFFEPANICLR